MEESTNDSVAGIGDNNVLSELNSTSPIQRGYTENKDDSSDDDAGLTQRHRRRIQFSDSDTEKENVHTRASDDNDSVPEKSDSEIETNNRPFKSLASKSRILMNSSGSDSEDNISTSVLTLKNEEQQMRMKNKRSKMQQKFKGLLTSRCKHTEVQNLSDNPSSEGEKSGISDEASDNDMSSIANIKQKIKKSMAAIPSICDPDTSDEESNISKNKHLNQGKKKVQRSTKMIKAKPIRMSAKQAMENMQLIKSESNRMLREKAVSLPYHRPKALSLKDIMSRRKPAVTSDGKALPIKMNEEQLKQYALQLEQRQKEMMELCKSESDEDPSEPELEEKTENVVPNNSNNKELEEKIENVVPSINKEHEENTENVDPSINKDLETIEEPRTVEITINDIHTNMEINTSDEINIVQTDSIEGTSMEKYISDTVNNERQSEKRNDSMNSETNQNHSNTDLRLVYNDDSVEEENVKLDDTEHPIEEDEVIDKTSEQVEAHKIRPQEINSSEQESQLISLHYTENGTDKLKETDIESDMKDDDLENEVKGSSEEIENFEDDKQDNFFSDDDVNMDDIDRIIENAEIMKDNDEYTSSPMLIKDPLTIKPKLEGAPGMVIDLFGTDVMPKRSGIELLKERFTYFSKLKTPEEKERDRERKTKPGSLHLKLKHELEEKIAEQRSLEWAKRLQEEKQLHQEKDAILDDADEADDSIEKMEAKIDEENYIGNNKSESESEEELLENDIDIKDKPRKHNPMVDDEAEESDIDEDDKETGQQKAETNEDMEEDDDNIEDDDSEDEESSSDDESSEDEDQTTKPKKGRILKAFEDSDDEDNVTKLDNLEPTSKDTIEHDKLETVKKNDHETENTAVEANSSDIQNSSQDDVIQLAQRRKSSVSEDLFASQEGCTLSNVNKDLILEASDDPLGTQTFSIASAKPSEFLYPSQPYHDPNLNGVVNNLSQNVLGSQLLTTQCSQSQPIGEDILALCTGQFYNNEFVPTCDINKPTEPISQDPYIYDSLSDQHPKSDTVTPIVEDNLDLSYDKIEENGNKSEEIVSKVEENSSKTEENNSKIEENSSKISEEKSSKDNEDRDVLKSILDELDEPEFDQPKPNRFFTGAPQNKNVIVESSHMKKRLIIDSDDETNKEGDMVAGESKKKKKLKKRKLEKRALQISDDEDEEDDLRLEEADYGSEVEEDGDREVEYDSEENEIEIKPDKPKKKRPANAFFEQEAELTSEDDWVGSGDEDEHGLDRMEREEGDDDVFHQGKLRKELGQIHMRDVLDQDKREVRLLQELLFEDGDLGGGHRQRKFRWRNAGDEETGTVPDDLTDTQEEEFESEEQWRKQRHEREVFLRQMQNQGEEENVNVTVNRTTIIKANLCSKSMSTLLMEVNQSKTETKDSPVVPEKKTIRDIPSPKKSFSILQQKYHSSVLNRGSTALARLAALATPLATADEDTPKIAALDSRKRNFVFAALTPDEDKPKVTIKRKAITNIGTPNLVKKIRLEEKQDHRKSSLLDHLNT